MFAPRLDAFMRQLTTVISAVICAGVAAAPAEAAPVVDRGFGTNGAA